MKREGTNNQQSLLPQQKKQKLSHTVPPPCLEIVPSSPSWTVLPKETWGCIACLLDTLTDLAAFEMVCKTFQAVAANRWNTFATDFFPINVLPVFKDPLQLSQLKKLLNSIWKYLYIYRALELGGELYSNTLTWNCPICKILSNRYTYNEVSIEEWEQESIVTAKCENCLELYNHAFEWTFNMLTRCCECGTYDSKTCLDCRDTYCSQCGNDGSDDELACSCYFICRHCYELCEHCEKGACSQHTKPCVECGMNKCAQCLQTKLNCIAYAVNMMVPP